MKPSHKYIINVIATGFVTLAILSILLFWARRKVCQTFFYGKLTGEVKLQPSGLVPEADSDPNVVTQSSIDTGIEHDVIALGLGIVQDFSSLEHGKSGEFFMVSENKGEKRYELVLFNKNTGLFVYYEVFKERKDWSRKAKLYAGPEGISKNADKSLGRFSEPSVNLRIGYIDSFTFFDRSSSRFFQIRFNKRTVVKSPQFSEVVQIGRFEGFDKNRGSLSFVEWSAPLRKQTPLDEENKKKIRTSIRDKEGNEINLVSATEEYGTGTYSRKDILVLESDGQIRRLDSKTLEISGPVGYLPSAVDSVGRARPKDLFAYAVQPFAVNDEYAGAIAASISREAMKIQVAVFDKDGKLIKRKGACIDPFDKAWGPTLTILTYLLENLQPAFLGMVSYFTASTFEAVDGHTGLFILPNSFVAILGRKANTNISPLFIALLIISPSIILGLLLGWKVYKEAIITGFSKRARLHWLIGTILFGISAYITYRLTRPKETLVSCQNCGKLRRPDMARCHRCGSKWFVPELIPPKWRVIDTSYEKSEG